LRGGSCDPARPVQGVIGGLAGSILLLILTCGSVSVYQVSGLLPGIAIALVLLVLLALAIIAAGCRYHARTAP